MNWIRNFPKKPIDKVNFQQVREDTGFFLNTDHELMQI